jgi:hypothetical protein
MVRQHHSSRNFQKIGADGLEIAAKEIAQPEVQVDAEVLTPTEQQPA